MIHTLKKVIWFIKAWLANVVYGFPSNKICLIGVTGTDGKTTTTSMIYEALVALGEKVSYISTVKAHIAGKAYDTGFHVTTPSPFFIQRCIRDAVKAGNTYFVLETTSHALDQLRVWGCHYRVAALTNITKEHLDYHNTIESYGKTKLSLINRADIAVVNADNPTQYLFKSMVKNKNIWFTSVRKKADFTYSELTNTTLQSLGGFERENVLLAYGVLRVLGFKKSQILLPLAHFSGVEGRLDYIEKGGKRFMVDFAHTPNAFLRLYEYIEKKYSYKRLIHVFGCAGLRDKQKRPVMGRYAAQHADVIILTEEDYRTESIDSIFSHIEAGINKEKHHEKDVGYFCIPNRLDAIKKAISLARKDDLIIMTGKAHEKSLARGKREYDWSEFEAIDTALNS
ncbi:MAG: UDP-N-acetylmuramyl-tripeptide synthetase [Candidatus Roizmanbacteria bacterium]|nr:UDP-N-acetylmuramyl-tripeptide synthetase [Candidatus Roizmanbacteria bacterium]